MKHLALSTFFPLKFTDDLDFLGQSYLRQRTNFKI